jgi:hypothetical protein
VAAAMVSARRFALDRGADIEHAETFFHHEHLVFTNIEYV